MIGRRVREIGTMAEGVVIEWVPLSHALCDVKVGLDNGDIIWMASHCLKAIDGLGPLPTRQQAISRAKMDQKRQLEAIRRQHIENFDKPWPGMNFGKAIIGNAINAALDELE